MARLVVAALLLVCLIGQQATVLGFDAGPHTDLLNSAMTLYGYSKNASTLAYVSNWLVDYWSTNAVPTVPAMERGHAESLHSLEEAAAYLSIVHTNALAALAQCQTPHQFLIVLGMASHMVQDFYAHSTFGQASGLYRSSCQCLRNTSFWGAFTHVLNHSALFSDTCTACSDPLMVARNTPALLALYPDHGEYTWGLNRDSQARPNFEEAFVSGFFATAELLAFVQQAFPTMSAQAKAWEPTTPAQATELKLEAKYAYEGNMFTAMPGEWYDGFWKGPYSGNTAKFLMATMTYMKNLTSIKNTTYASIPYLTKNLYSNWTYTLPTIPDVSGVTGGLSLLVIRAFAVSAPSGSWPVMRTTVNGQLILEPALVTSGVAPFWKVLAFIPSSSNSTVSIELANFQTSSSLDINPSASSTTFNFQVDPATKALSGDATGIHDSQTNSVTAQGDSASLSFYVDIRTLSACQGTSKLICPADQISVGTSSSSFSSSSCLTPLASVVLFLAILFASCALL